MSECAKISSLIDCGHVWMVWALVISSCLVCVKILRNDYWMTFCSEISTVSVLDWLYALSVDKDTRAFCTLYHTCSLANASTCMCRLYHICLVDVLCTVGGWFVR